MLSPKFDNQAVATELATIAKKLSAFCFISDNGATTKEQAVAYSRNFTAREAMMIFGDWQSFDVDKKIYDVDYATARACAVQAWIDKNIGWHKNISNVEVNGVTGVTKPVSFDINEPSTDANFLNEKNITVCLNFNGFRYWGSRTLSSDTAFSFQQATRTAQIIKETMAAAHSWLVDQPITVTNVKFAINSLNNKFAEWKRNGYILDGKAWVNKEITADTLKSGELIIDYDYHWVPSGESLRFNQHVNDSYVMDLVNAITKL
ncbi:phage tail sheath subtilisin-like domain-containing protein [Actinobacillus equuli subsp. haemolyticus]|nr:phage tail sheath subtilisin-like domain-containing protein [Actinobacillus equuli]MDG4948727.1 phage tail sheath subtilisin-like domain-containing protein [Actinobacillus equuli subsp. haemolyticus]